ncbi:MAG: hypothetical protein ACRCYU_15855 [Nocardioides sp.]
MKRGRQPHLCCAGLVAALVLGLAGCADDNARRPAESAGPAPTRPPDSRASSPPPSSAEQAGPTTAILDWQPTTKTVEAGRRSFTIRNKTTVLVEPATGSRTQDFAPDQISDVLLDQAYGVVVAQDPEEERAGRATIWTADGTTFVIDRSSSVPTVNGGTWALGQGQLVHATYGPQRSYCLASVDLVSRKSSIAWCAPKNHGFNDARITPAGLTVLSFTLGKDGCRTPVLIGNGKATTIDGVTECIGWDGLVTADGAIWSETPKPNRIEEATFFAIDSAGQERELGAGDTGSLTWCGDSAYFTQQPLREGEPARLLRWHADALSIAYETPGSPGFLTAPRCGGSQLTISAKSEGGDEQVTASVE